jgi:hypothetical protein
LGTGSLALTVDDQTYDVPANAGEFDWLVPIGHPAEPTRVAMKFSASSRLPGADNRPTAARLELLEVLPALPIQTFNFATIGSARPAASGIDQDGWMARHAEIALPACDTPTQLSLKVELPQWGGQEHTVLHVRIDGTAPHVETLPPGYATVHVTVPAGSGPRTVHIEAEQDFPLTAPDTRRRIGRLLELTLGPTA